MNIRLTSFHHNVVYVSYFRTHQPHTVNLPLEKKKTQLPASYQHLIATTFQRWWVIWTVMGDRLNDRMWAAEPCFSPLYPVCTCCWRYCEATHFNRLYQLFSSRFLLRAWSTSSVSNQTQRGSQGCSGNSTCSYCEVKQFSHFLSCVVLTCPSPCRKMMDSGQIDFYQHDSVCSNSCRSSKSDAPIISTLPPPGTLVQPDLSCLAPVPAGGQELPLTGSFTLRMFDENDCIPKEA